MLNRKKFTFYLVVGSISETVHSLLITMVSFVEFLNFSILFAEDIHPPLVFVRVVVSVTFLFSGLKLSLTVICEDGLKKEKDEKAYKQPFCHELNV